MARNHDTALQSVRDAIATYEQAAKDCPRDDYARMQALDSRLATLRAHEAALVELTEAGCAALTEEG